MKTLLLLLLFSVAFARHLSGGRGGKPQSQNTWKSVFRWNRRHDIPRARVCVWSECAMRKCERMVMELNYKYEPKLQWSCVKAPNLWVCMKYVEKGRADLVSIPGIKAYKAEKHFKLLPILRERYNITAIPQYDNNFKPFEQDGDLKHYSVALIKKTSSGLITKLADLEGKKSCHYDITTHATFKNPMCSLIESGVIKTDGNVYERVAEYFKSSCVPGAQTQGYWNQNRTMPDSLCSLCNGTGENFCQMKKSEPLYGYKGALKCLKEYGDVGFFHSYDVLKDYDKLRGSYALVCKENVRKIKSWRDIMACHINVEYPNVIVVDQKTAKPWKNKVIQVLLQAQLKSTSKVNGEFNLFSSDSYCPTTNEDVMWRKKNLIFSDDSMGFKTVKTPYLEPKTIEVLKKCKSLTPKPRAFICVVGREEKEKCLEMKKYFAQEQTTKKITIGCVEAVDRYDCMLKVKRGVCDIVSLNATEMFIAGKKFNLVPFIGEHHMKLNKLQNSESIIVGVIRKAMDPIKNLNKLKMCIRSDQMLTSYHHPLGWLMSNGTIPRTRERVMTRYFSRGCFPGIDKLDLTKDYISKHLLDWESFVTHREVDWKSWYENPEWRNPQQNTPDDRWYKTQDWKCKKFEYVKNKLHSPMPWKRCKKYEMKVRGIMTKVEDDFNWDNYAFDDFYSLFPCSRFVHKFLDVSQFESKLEMRAFMDWIKLHWKNDACLHVEHRTWTDSDWTKFKTFIDNEYKDLPEEKPHKDTFIRLYVLRSRLEYLRQQWKKLQWTLPEYKNFRKLFCSTCTGQPGKECSVKDVDNSNHKDILHCVYNEGGDLGFMDGYKLESTITKHGYSRDDFKLFCPSGKVIDYTGPQSFTLCNFGRIPTKALVTCKNHDGVWRSEITKAFLEAQKLFKGVGTNKWNFDLFKENVIFSKDINRLVPIQLKEQTYQQWLGLEFLRSMEGLFYDTPLQKYEDNDDEYFSFDNDDYYDDDRDYERDEYDEKDKYDDNADYSDDDQDGDDDNDDDDVDEADKSYRQKRYMERKGKFSRKGYWRKMMCKNRMCRKKPYWKKYMTKYPIGETYTTIIHNKTCTGISEELRCFGKPKIVNKAVGKVTKTPVAVPLCHMPSFFVKRLVYFTCSNGVEIMEPVMVPTKCSYMPCTKSYWIPHWLRSSYWTGQKPYDIQMITGDEKLVPGYRYLRPVPVEKCSKRKPNH